MRAQAAAKSRFKRVGIHLLEKSMQISQHHRVLGTLYGDADTAGRILKFGFTIQSIVKNHFIVNHENIQLVHEFIRIKSSSNSSIN